MGTSSTIFYKLKEELESAKDELKDEIISILSYIGEQCVTYAREPHDRNWGDVTGNLRSSIGYVVLWDGRVAVNGRPVRYSGLRDGSEGVAEGERLMNSLQSNFPTGAVLIIVAGMNYASYVESRHGKDVLSGAGVRAEELVEKLLSDLVNKTH